MSTATTTTIPSTTVATITTVPSGSCTNIPDYATLRKQNLDQINKYYNELLQSYAALGTGSNLDNAQNLVNTYHNQMNSAGQELLSNLKNSIENVNQQYNTLHENKELTIANRKRMVTLRRDMKSLAAEADARRQNTEDNTKTTDTLNRWHLGYLSGNIILLLANAGIVAYLTMYSSR